MPTLQASIGLHLHGLAVSISVIHRKHQPSAMIKLRNPGTSGVRPLALSLLPQRHPSETSGQQQILRRHVGRGDYGGCGASQERGMRLIGLDYVWKRASSNRKVKKSKSPVRSSRFLCKWDPQSYLGASLGGCFFHPFCRCNTTEGTPIAGPPRQTYKTSNSPSSYSLLLSDSTINCRLAVSGIATDTKTTYPVSSLLPANNLMDLKRIHCFEIPRQAHLALEEGDDSR